MLIYDMEKPYLFVLQHLLGQVKEAGRRRRGSSAQLSDDQVLAKLSKAIKQKQAPNG